MPRGGKRPGAGRPKGSGKKVEPEKPKVSAAALAGLKVVDGGDGALPEPDWSLIFCDTLDQAIAKQQWSAVVRELRETEKLASANVHQIKRYVVSCVLYEQAARQVAESGACFPAKGKKQPSYNPWFSILKDANAMASAAEAELTVTPRRRNNGGKVQPKQKKAGPGGGYLSIAK